MYLTRAFLDPTSREVLRDARSPEDLHKTVMKAFPDGAGPTARATHGVLHRLDQDRPDRFVLLVQSLTRPNLERWPERYLLDMSEFDQGFSGAISNPATRETAAERASIRAEQRFTFRLRANTTRKIDTKSTADGQRRNGRRVPVRGDEERAAWLKRHAEAAGFQVAPGALRITELAPTSGRSAKAVTLAGALFEGILVVRDPELFRNALAAGIGPAKAYGFGLLSIAPAR